MPQGDPGSSGLPSLRDWAGESTDGAARRFHDVETGVALSDLARGTSLGGRLAELRGRSVLIATGDQLTTALALIELDGVARRLILCPPDVAPEHLPSVIADAGVDALVSATVDETRDTGVALAVTCGPVLAPRTQD